MVVQVGAESLWKHEKKVIFRRMVSLLLEAKRTPLLAGFF
jgi:hypothetical protein